MSNGFLLFALPLSFEQLCISSRALQLKNNSALASAARSVLTQSFQWSLSYTILLHSFPCVWHFWGRRRKKQHSLPLIPQQPTSKTPVFLKPSLKILYSVVASKDQYNIIQYKRYNHISNKHTWKLRTYICTEMRVFYKSTSLFTTDWGHFLSCPWHIENRSTKIKTRMIKKCQLHLGN